MTKETKETPTEASAEPQGDALDRTRPEKPPFVFPDWLIPPFIISGAVAFAFPLGMGLGWLLIHAGIWNMSLAGAVGFAATIAVLLFVNRGRW